MNVTTANISLLNISTPALEIPIQSNALQRIISYVLTGIIAVVMIGMGCGVDFYKLKGHILKPTGIVVGFSCQFILMPIIAFALAKVAQMDDVQTLALLIVGSCPGGTASNIGTYWAGADLDLSISMTAISTTLGLGMMPLLLFIYSFGFNSSLQVPFQTIGIALGSLIIPIIIGMCIRMKFPEQAKKILKVLSSIGSLAILAAVIVSLVSYGSALRISSAQIACAAVFPGIGMGLGYGLSSLVSLISPLYLKHEERRTICIETGVQNTQLAGAVIQLSFSFRQIVRMLLFPLAYLISELVWIALLVIGYRIYIWKYKDNQEDLSAKEEKYKNNEVAEEKGKVNLGFYGDLPQYSDVVSENEKHTKL